MTKSNKKSDKKQPSILKITARLYIEYDEVREGGDQIDPNDKWSSRTDTDISVKFVRLHREQPKHRFFYHSIEVNDRMLKMDKLFLAVVRYSTGDTFGHTNGAWYVVGAAPTYQIADMMLAEEIKPSKPGHYKRWEGHFERLEGTEIHELSVV